MGRRRKFHQRSEDVGGGWAGKDAPQKSPTKIERALLKSPTNTLVMWVVSAQEWMRQLTRTRRAIFDSLIEGGGERRAEGRPERESR